MVGLEPGARLDAALYAGDAPAKGKASKKRKAGDDGADGDDNGAGDDAGKASQRAAAGPVYYNVCVGDNGRGMAHDDIPQMLAVVLSGTKYGVRQARGKFGLGAKMALIWAKQTTGQPIEVRSATRGSPFISVYVLDLDLRSNSPHVHSVAKEDNPEGWHGTTISVTIRGAWSAYRHKILQYLRQLAVITPYADVSFRYHSEAGKRQDVGLHFRRRTEHMPPPPGETRYHPSAVDLETIRSLMRGTKAKNMRSFLSTEFTSINTALADRLLAECGHGITAGGDPKTLTGPQVMALHRLFSAAKFPPPSGECLSPAGEYNLRLGVVKELRPELVATYCGPPCACGGHPFMVEAAVSLGGKDVKPGLNVFRFANRIPLLFEAGSDVIVKQAADIDWGRYRVDKATAKIGVFVSLVSTRIPFRGTGKEHIAEDVTEIAEEVRKAIQHCASQLSKKLAKREAAKQRKARRKALQRYIPDAARAIYSVLSKMVDRTTHSPAKRRRLAAAAAGAMGMRGDDPMEGADDPSMDLLDAVKGGSVTEATLRTKLEQHIEQADADTALEVVMNTARAAAAGAAAGAGGAGASVCLTPLTGRHMFGPAVKAPAWTFRLLL